MKDITGTVVTFFPFHPNMLVRLSNVETTLLVLLDFRSQLTLTSFGHAGEFFMGVEFHSKASLHNKECYSKWVYLQTI